MTFDNQIDNQVTGTIKKLYFIIFRYWRMCPTYSSLFELEEKLLSVLGLLPLPDITTPKWKYFVHSLYSAIVIHFTAVVLTLVSLIFVIDTAEDRSKTLTHIIVWSMILVKLLAFYMRREKINTLWKVFKAKWVQLYKRNDYETIQLLKCTEKRIKTLIYLLHMLAAVAVITLSTVPIIETLTEGSVQTAGPINLPLVVWLPFSVNDVPTYAATCLICSATAMFMTQMFTVLISSIVVILTNLTIQIQIMNKSMMKMSKMVKSEIELKSYLGGWIQEHQELFGYAVMIEDAFSPLFLALFVMEGFMICFTGYHGALDPIGNAHYTFASILSIFHMFIYCSFADRLSNESILLAKAAYECGWELEETPIAMRTSIMIIIARAQKPIQITAAKFFALSLDSFIKLLNTSYSYFTLLRTLNPSAEAK